jgi:CheY-like chemotaxis protein
MPKLNGLEATRRIRKRGEDCVFPIVAMSTDLTTHERATALAAGCDGFITEPIDFDNVSDVLSDLLQGSSSRRLQESDAGL